MAGHLKKIRLEDFMCHECFEMEFGPHITLVSGTNGSGKSAVMQALQVSLGVSARTTMRGPNLSHFIRSGANEARVIVTICNKGPDAFEHDKFGDFIMVERRIILRPGDPPSTSSSYILKNAGGRTVQGSPKDLLDAMTEHYAIDAANPLTIVTQDMARCFLSGAKDDNRKKYDMYMKGTLLYQIQDSLQEAFISLSNSIQCVSIAKKTKQDLEAKLKEVNTKISQLQDLDEQAKLMDQIVQIRSWAMVAACESQITDIQEQLETLPEQEEELQERIETVDAQRRAAAQQVQAVGEEMNRAAAGDAQAKEGLLEAKNRAAAARTERNRLQAALERSRQELENVKNSCEHFKEKMLKGADNEKVAQAKARLQEFEMRIQELKNAADQHQQDFARLRSVYTELTGQQDVLKKQWADLHHRVVNSQSYVQSLENEKKELEQSTKNRAMAFGGRAVCQLVELIKRNARNFQHQPIGPVGAYLSITDPKWSVSIDTGIGRLLTNFICFSKQDAELLRRLASQAQAQQVTVIQTRPGLSLHNITRKPKEGYVTILDMIEVSKDHGPQVAIPIVNMLVDSAKVEQVVLVNNDNDGRDVIYNNAAGPGFNAISLNGISFQGGKMQTVRPRQNNRPPSLGMSATQQVQQLGDLIAKEATELGKHQEALTEVEGKLRLLEARIKDVDKECMKLQSAKREAINGMNKLQNQANDLAPEAADDAEDARLRVATETLQELQVDITKAQMECNEKEQELEAARKRHEELNQAYMDLRGQVQARNDYSSYQREIQRAAEAEGEAGRELKGLQDQLQKLRDTIKEYKQVLEAEQENLPFVTGLAQEVCTKEQAAEAELVYKEHMLRRKLEDTPNMSESEQAEYLEAVLSSEALDAEEKRLGISRRTQEQALGGSKEELELECRQLNKQVAKQTGVFYRIKTDQDALIKGHTTRIKALQALRDNVEKTCNEKFHMYLARRGHLGQLTVDHEQEVVKIKVKVKGASDPNATWVTDLKQLSGGERSYTTVAFLLALGQWSESSFRCLDEFDVFMDAINRRIAVETLLENALELPDKQYVLLTPQDIQAIELARQLLETKKKIQIPEFFVKTVQMRPARR